MSMIQLCRSWAKERETKVNQENNIRFHKNHVHITVLRSNATQSHRDRDITLHQKAHGKKKEPSIFLLTLGGGKTLPLAAITSMQSPISIHHEKVNLYILMV